MCDCYEHKCKECKATVPVHLGDFDTRRNEIEVFCEKHIPKKNVTIFTLIEDEYDMKLHKDDYIEYLRFKKGHKMAIRYLTQKAKQRKQWNHLNTSTDFKRVSR